MNGGSIERALTVANAVRAIRRWWWLLLLCTIISASGAFLSTRKTPRYYQAVTTLYVGRVLQQLNPDPNSVTLLDRLTAVYASLAVRQPVLDAAAQSVDPPATAGEIVSRVNVRAVNGTQFIEITYLDQDPNRAAQIVTAIGNALIKQGPKPTASQDPQQSQFVQTQLAMLQTQINDAQAQIVQLDAGIGQSSSAAEIADAQEKEKVLRTQVDGWRTSYAALLSQTQPSETNYLTVVEPAAIPTRPVGSSRISTIGLAGFLGFLLAFAVVLLLEALDDTAREPESVRARLGLVTVATLASSSKGKSPDTASFGSVRNYLLQGRINDELRVLVTAPTMGVGVSSTAHGIAEAFARSGRRVILVDANVTAPTLHERHQIPLSPGLIDAIRWPTEVHCSLHASTTPNLLIVPAGEASSDDDFAGPGISLVFAAMVEAVQADVLIVDGGAVKDATSAACILAAELSYTILVVDAHTRLRMLRTAMEALIASGTQPIGVIFNQHTRPRRNDKHPVRASVPVLASGERELTATTVSPAAPVPLYPLVGGGTFPQTTEISRQRRG